MHRVLGKELAEFAIELRGQVLLRAITSVGRPSWAMTLATV